MVDSWLTVMFYQLNSRRAIQRFPRHDKSMFRLVGTVRRYRHAFVRNLYVKPVFFVNHVELETFPFWIKPRIDGDMLFIGLNAAKAEHRCHPRATVCCGMRASHKDRSH